ncbi:MAG: tetratricopeptide repeat protein [Candidatus Edwardsbacteria bacterium]|nr:tetratricopeptide repeat protein [Candidatus Edwardsbacteria bacterium]MBU2593288.1 tetratricopeptide repeat protein [Candidatus Edwardsbacteria bacterium]
MNYSEQYRGRVRILWLSSPDDFHQTFHPHQLLQRKAEVLDIIGDWNQAEAIHRYSLELAEVQKDERLQAEGQVLLAGVLFKKGRYSETYDLLGKALKYYERVDDQQAVGRILAEIGNVHRAQGDYDRAMEFYQRHLKIAEALEDNYAISQTVGNMGNIYRVRGQHAQALAYTLKFLQNAQELGDKRNLGVAYGVLGNIYRHQGLLDKAMEVYRRQLVIMTELGDIRSRTYALGNVGRIYLLQYNYPMAREYYSRHLALAEELGDKRSISFAEGSLGGLYKALLAFPKALNHYQRAIDLCRELKLRPELAENLNQMVELFLLQGKAGQAKQLNAEALEVAAEIGKQEIKFASRLLQARIAAQSDRTAAEGMMRALVDDRLNHSQTAEVCYQLFKLTGDFDDKRKARVAYQSAYNAAPDLAVRLRLEELTEME